MDCTNKNCPAYAKCLAPYRGSMCKATRATYGLGDPLTNYDLLIRKSPVEMAVWVWGVETAGRAYGPCGKKYWLDWLRKEVD